MSNFVHLDDADAAAFDRDGYVFKRGMLQPRRWACATASSPPTTPSRAAGSRSPTPRRGDRARLWNHPGEDVFGMIARCERVAGGAERILGGEVYHYHSKLTMKRPGGGGRWEWHQDYGYWYQNGCLWPDMLSVAVALEPATRENGCMQVLRAATSSAGSSTAGSPGRPAPIRSGSSKALERLELVHCEMAPGDALFFHANTLHCSAANHSDGPRNLLLCCYNKATNDPYKPHHHPGYTQARRVPDEAVLAAGDHVADAAGRWFLEEGKDETTEARKAG